VAVPENRVYVSADAVIVFLRSFLAFSHGKVVSDDAKAPGAEIGMPDKTYRRIRLESGFGKLTVLVTDGISRIPTAGRQPDTRLPISTVPWPKPRARVRRS